ncbi:hypothetical protein ACFVAJ_19355 [Agromyces sp. NPDC057679]|uniref:hypothetical protein n=1 Tax=Agromyces sp. NPDC057679 TaxID=3346207 RepID=UPI00366BAF7D
MNQNQPVNFDGVDAALDELGRTVAAAAEQGDAVQGTAIAVTGVDTALARKERMALQARTAMNAQKSALEMRAKVRDEIETARKAAEAMLAEARRREQEIMATLEPMIEQAKIAAEGIEALNLYLGRDEWVHTIREGVPAPATEPLIIRQTVVAFDEESALNAEAGGIEYSDVEEFDAWLLADPRHLDQVVPEPKSIVAAIARRSDVFTGDPWEDDARNKLNHLSWLLIRNGENLYRINISEEFTVGERLVPKSDEFTSLFLTRGRDGASEPLKPGTDEWVKAEKHANAKTRHYMKIALTVQGLVDRTAYLRPLPEGVSVIEQSSYDAGHVRVITDGENAIDSGRPSFDAWLSEKMKLVRPGIRVVGFYRPVTSRDWNGRGQIDNISPTTARSPESLQVHTITRMDSDGCPVFTYARTDEVWTDYGLRPAKTRASFTIMGHDNTVVPIDFVTEEELRYYLESRSERRAYLKMFPALRAALELLIREREEEAPFRALLTAELQKKHPIGELEAEDRTDELVRWWKTANKWNRALNGDQDAETKAARVILREAARRAKAASVGGDEQIIAQLRDTYSDLLAVARRTNDYVAVQRIIRKWQCSDPKWNTKVATETLFVRLIIVKPSGKVSEIRDWQHLTRASIARWEILWEDEAWAGWDLTGSRQDHLTDPEIDEVIEKALEYAGKMGWTPISVILGEDKFRYAAIHGAVHYVDGTTATLATEGAELTGKHDASFQTKSFEIWAEKPGDFGRHRYESVENWRRANRRFRNDEPVPTGMQAPWEQDIKRHRLVWADVDAVERVRADAEAWGTVDDHVRSLRSKVSQLFKEIEDAWLAREWEARRLRFIEDYGDASLWEDHQKSVTVTLPTQRTARQTNPSDWAELHTAIVSAVEARRPLAGLTVRDAFGSDITEEWPDRIAELRFAAKDA